MHELQETIKDKEDCIKEHDFEAAKQLLDHEMEVRTHIRIMKQSALTSEARGFSRRDVDMVTETDVSDVVSNWTGIPVTKITGSESARLLKWKTQFTNVLLVKDTRCISFKSEKSTSRFTRSKSTNCKFYIRWTNWCWKTELTKLYLNICSELKKV
jgi:ATP-dependent Clp protease ATP-binding subunit ClpC